MTTPTNWPNPERPGEPMFPERDGLHVICGSSRDNPTLLWWRAKERCYTYPQASMRNGPFIYADEVWRIYTYSSPVLTPTQIAEMLAGERERCLAACESAKVPVDGWGDPIDDGDADRNEGIDDAMAAIRNLGAAS